MQRHQSLIRLEIYNINVDSMRQGDVHATNVGKRVIPYASVRPDIVAWVFKMKLDIMMDDLTKNHVLGHLLAGIPSPCLSIFPFPPLNTRSMPIFLV